MEKAFRRVTLFSCVLLSQIECGRNSVEMETDYLIAESPFASALIRCSISEARSASRYESLHEMNVEVPIEPKGSMRRDSFG